MLQRTLPAGFIAPCLPTKTDKLPSSGQWLHEIKHDGFRVIALKDGTRVRLYSPYLHTPASSPRHCLEAQEFRLPFRALVRLAQDEKLGCTGSEARAEKEWDR
jgi:ATP-dependent DNA ligase